MLLMKHRIWLEKLWVVAIILHRDGEKENFAREILLEQLQQGWQGLTTEVTEICQLTGLPNVFNQYLSREKIEDAMIHHHLKEI